MGLSLSSSCQDTGHAEDQDRIKCCPLFQQALHHQALCRTLQLQKDRLEKRLSDIKAQGLVQSTPVPDAAASLPRDTVLHRALRDDKEVLKQELEVSPTAFTLQISFMDPQHTQAGVARCFMGSAIDMWPEGEGLPCRKRQCFTPLSINFSRPGTLLSTLANNGWGRRLAG